MDDFAEKNVREEAAGALASFLHCRTADSKVTGKRQMEMHLPEGVSQEELAALLADMGTEEAPAALEKMAAVQGKKDLYYYDASIMTKHYAEIDALLEDKDILQTIATVTRSDSKLYPRPTQFSKLMDVPFRFSKDEILGAAARMKSESGYEDIDVVTASNGKAGFFSSQSLSHRYAQSLIEAIEVEANENP